MADFSDTNLQLGGKKSCLNDLNIIGLNMISCCYCGLIHYFPLMFACYVNLQVYCLCQIQVSSVRSLACNQKQLH